MSTHALQILVSFPSATIARRTIRALLDQRLIACAHLLGGVESHYVWQGKQERALERLVLLKTTAGRFRQVEILIRSIHPYQVPEILALPIVKGHRPYLRWLTKETGSTFRKKRTGRSTR